MSDRFFYSQKLDIGYNNKALIKDIAFDIQRGEIVALIGSNGSGKSTLLRTLAKQIDSIKGDAYIEAESIKNMSYEEISKRISIMLTDKVKAELLSVYDVVSSGRYPYTKMMGRLDKADRKIVEMVMADCGIKELSDKEFSKLSDGQKQRVMFARALAQEPKVLILDEPTAFLDIKYKVMLFDLLKIASHQKKISVLMSIHEVDLAMKVADRIIALKDDKVFAYGSAREIADKKLIMDLFDIDEKSYSFIFE